MRLREQIPPPCQRQFTVDAYLAGDRLDSIVEAERAIAALYTRSGDHDAAECGPRDVGPQRIGARNALRTAVHPIEGHVRVVGVVLITDLAAENQGSATLEPLRE